MKRSKDLGSLSLPRFGPSANRGFAKAYIQALVSEISVSAREIRISGPKAALAHSAAVFAKKGELVPAFAQEWRTGEGEDGHWVILLL